MTPSRELVEALRPNEAAFALTTQYVAEQLAYECGIAELRAELAKEEA